MSDVNLPGGQPVLTFYTKEGSDYISSITQDGQSVSLSVFPCGSYAIEKHFFASGVDKETVAIKQNSDWFTVSRASVFEDASNPDECGFMIIIQQNFGFERSGTFIIQSGGMDYTVSVRQLQSNKLKLTGMSVLNATCNGDCAIDEYHYACTRKSLVLATELPERGYEGTTYMIGTHTSDEGLSEYVWSNASGWVYMGVAAANLVNPATTEILGLAKLSTSDVISDGANIGVNSDLQLKVPLATASTSGAVKLGSAFEGKNDEPYRVGITADLNGQLVFNLKVDGGLKYERTGNKWELRAVDATDSEKGVVVLLNSIAGLSDEDIEARRDTHAASVGLVKDSLEAYVRKYVDDVIAGRRDIEVDGVLTSFQELVRSEIAKIAAD